jgi:carbonic anhydrase
MKLGKKLSILLLPIVFSISSAIAETKWSYSGDTGPKNWGSLDEKFKFCKIGYNQSPIDIKSSFAPHDLEFFYSDSDVEKEPEQFSVKVGFYGNSYLKRIGKKYYLRSLYFRHPSEHLLNGKASDLEMQIAHKSNDEQYLIVSLLISLGEVNKNFANLLESLRDGGSTKINLSALVSAKDLAFFYEGSFTTPPCKEGVKWYVMKTPIKISKDQMEKIIKLTIPGKTNARDVQSYNPENY